MNRFELALPSGLLRWSSLLLVSLVAACGGGGNDDGSSPAQPGPVISSFQADMPATNAGRAETLSWVVTGASTLTLQPGAIDVTGRTSMAVTPIASTTYTLVATNTAGSTQALANVRIYDWTQAEAQLDSFVKSSGTDAIAGYSFVAFDRSGTLFTRAGGNQTADSVEPLASATKLPSVAAILTLVDSGQVSLDTPVAQYLALDSTFNWPTDKSAITIRMLLAHTSGLAGLTDGQAACVQQPNASTMKACAQTVANSTLVSAPNSSFDYGGEDFLIAGYAATLITGQTWQAFFASRIGTPVGMASYTFGNVPNPNIAGGASSNAGDYAKFVMMIQAGGVVGATRVLSTAMVAELEKDQIAGKTVIYTPIPNGAAASYPGYGFGVFISSPSLYPGSNGPEFSDPGAFGTVPWFDNGLGYGAVLLIDDTTATGFDIWNQIRPLIINQLRAQGTA